MTQYIPWSGLLGIAIQAGIVAACIWIGARWERANVARDVAVIRRNTLSTLDDHRDAIAKLR